MTLQPPHFVAGPTDPANQDKPIYPTLNPVAQTMRSETAAVCHNMLTPLMLGLETDFS